MVDIPRIFKHQESAHRIHNPSHPKSSPLSAGFAPGTGGPCARPRQRFGGDAVHLGTRFRDRRHRYRLSSCSPIRRNFALKSSASPIGSSSSTPTLPDTSPTKRSMWHPGVGATWIGGGVAGTIDLLATSLRTGELSSSVEPYWLQLPPTEDAAKDARPILSPIINSSGLIASSADLGYDVVEMVLADREGWDRYEGAKWFTMRRWLEANPEDDLAKEVRAQLTSGPERYARYTREYMGWGVFALMAR